MADVVGKDEVARIRRHYDEYHRDLMAGVPDTSDFRNLSTWYINRLLRYIEVDDMIKQLEADEVESEHGPDPKT